MPVSWTLENERKFMLKIIHLVNSKDIDATELATHFPGATPRAITEHLYVLRKEAKALPGGPQVRKRGAAEIDREEDEGVGAGGEGEQRKKRGWKLKVSGDDVGGEGERGGDVIGAVSVKKKKKGGRAGEKDEEAMGKVDGDDAQGGEGDLEADVS